MGTQISKAVVDGILTGGVYALMAAGLTLIFGVMQIINIAQGILVVLGAYLSYSLLTYWHIDPFVGLVLTVPIAVLADRSNRVRLMLVGAGIFAIFFAGVGRGRLAHQGPTGRNAGSSGRILFPAHRFGSEDGVSRFFVGVHAGGGRQPGRQTQEHAHLAGRHHTARNYARGEGALRRGTNALRARKAIIYDDLCGLSWAGGKRTPRPGPSTSVFGMGAGS